MGSLKDSINADLKSAMLARDQLRVQTLQGLKTAILYEEVAKNAREKGLDEASIEQIVAREVKKRDEAITLYKKGGNSQSANKERSEKEVLLAYLPAQLSQDELNEVVMAKIATIKPAGMQDMGKVISAIKAEVGNKADGATIAKLVKEQLQ